eukprot:381767_1
MATPFKRIDGALAQHYANCNRNDYLDENGIGKFMRFVKKHAFDEDAIDLELGDDVNDPNDCLFIEMDPMFPLPISATPNKMTKESRDIEILKILKHCYTHGVPPSLNSIHRLLGISPRQSHDNAFVLTWQHIANALNHELYDKMSSSFMVIVSGNKRFEDVNELLEEIKNKKHIHHNELNYIRELMERATQFDLNNNDKYATHYHSERTQKRCDMDDILIALDDTGDPRL